jgi:hypothetical protein
LAASGTALPCVTLEHQCRYRNRFDWKRHWPFSAQTVKGHRNAHGRTSSEQSCKG